SASSWTPRRGARCAPRSTDRMIDTRATEQPMTPAIEISGLTKSFGGRPALDGLDLTVAAGQIHGFLGPNGAGKSTTMRILLGLVRADGGRVRLLGED